MSDALNKCSETSLHYDRYTKHISRYAKMSENDTTARCWTCGLMDKERVPLARWLGRNTASATSMGVAVCHTSVRTRRPKCRTETKIQSPSREKRRFKVHENRYLVSVA